jgi:hypothetical protein
LSVVVVGPGETGKLPVFTTLPASLEIDHVNLSALGALVTKES